MKNIIILTATSLCFCLSGCSANNSRYDNLKMMGYSDLNKIQLLDHIDKTYINHYVNMNIKNRSNIIKHKNCILKNYNHELSNQDLVITSLIYAENPNSISTATMFAIEHYGSNVVNTVINKVGFINTNCLINDE